MSLIDEIRDSVKHFNRLLPYTAADFAVYKVFQIYPKNHAERTGILSMRMEAIELLFKGGLRLKPDFRDSLSRNLSRYYWELVERLKTEGPYELSGGTKNIIADDFEHILKTLKLQADRKRLRRHNFPAFTSKLLHWTCPEAFPMRDTESLKTMHLEQKADYRSVIDYYLKLGEKLQMEMADLKKWLVKIDRESLPEGLKAQYSWVRVVDKWLWLPSAEKKGS